MTYFGARLRYLRKSENTTQQELADSIGVAKSTISMYENGQREPDFETLEALADHFNVDMRTFFPGNGSPVGFSSAQKESPTPGGVELTPTQQKAWEFIQQMDDEALERFIAAAKALMG